MYKNTQLSVGMIKKFYKNCSEPLARAVEHGYKTLAHERIGVRECARVSAVHSIFFKDVVS